MLRDMMRLLHSSSSQSHRNRVLLRSNPGWSRWILELVTRSYVKHPAIVQTAQAAAEVRFILQQLLPTYLTAASIRPLSQAATEVLSAQHAAKLRAQRSSGAGASSEAIEAAVAEATSGFVGPKSRTNKASAVYDPLLDPDSESFDMATAEDVRMKLNILTSTKYPARVRPVRSVVFSCVIGVVCVLLLSQPLLPLLLMLAFTRLLVAQARREAAYTLGDLKCVTAAAAMLDLMKSEEDEMSEEFVILILRHFPAFHPHLVVEMALFLLTKLQNEWTSAESTQLCLEMYFDTWTRSGTLTHNFIIQKLM